ncbi:hypothetical protein CAPTEDRAFT_218350 [Capitella teleta]|uniref:Uncharacterized protein n=1 Tax=Capitella teleta TaxID=283909 RepID=R7USL9_CAPTE|nr:hypothetical protein CAPTEDRAFT_218350 [Capitella teleta]|eukprot:ELU06917.1 hypothetical protein CAPTEDRAFT_218350 [Capitella teleta]
MNNQGEEKRREGGDEEANREESSVDRGDGGGGGLEKAPVEEEPDTLEEDDVEPRDGRPDVHRTQDEIDTRNDEDDIDEGDDEPLINEERELTKRKQAERRRQSQMYDIHEYELLGKGVKKILGMDLPSQCKNPIALLSCADQHKYLITDVEKNTMHVIDADREGLVKSFPYLFDYRFSGGMCNVNGGQAVALQNDKYNSVSYYDYSKDKEFKYSAFLDSDAKITDIASNSQGHIVALDANSKSLIIINESKSIKRRVTFGTDVVASAVAVTSDDDVYILNEADSSIIIFNSHCELTNSVPLHDPLSTGCKLVRGVHDSLLILNRNRIGLYSSQGSFSHVVVEFPPHVKVRDVTVSGDTLAVLLLSEQRAEVLVYKYQVPRSMRASKTMPVTQSACCSVM